MNNIILIGMPGCGKTTVARALAERLGRPWCDCDAEIVRREGMNISFIFEHFGEEYFRMRETECIQRLSALDRAIVATGGGAVRRNCGIIGSFSAVVYLRRPLEIIMRGASLSGRPLMRGSSPGESRLKLYELYRQRRGFYERCADMIIDNDSAPAEAAEKIITALNTCKRFKSGDINETAYH